MSSCGNIKRKISSNGVMADIICVIFPKPSSKAVLIYIYVIIN